MTPSRVANTNSMKPTGTSNNSHEKVGHRRRDNADIAGDRPQPISSLGNAQVGGSEVTLGAEEARWIWLARAWSWSLVHGEGSYLKWTMW
jgi:hypothetical protein